MHCVLIHGQGRSSFSLRVLGMRLRRAGYSVQYLDYFVHTQPFDAIVQQLMSAIRGLDADTDYVLIGHSLGGIIARAALPLLADRLPRHLFMLGTPNQSPLLARQLKNNRVYRALTTDSGHRLASPDFYADLALPNVATTIFAGTRGLRGRWSPWGNALNDGVVSVAETLINNDYPVILVPSIHTFIMNSPIVWHHMQQILANISQEERL